MGEGRGEKGTWEKVEGRKGCGRRKRGERDVGEGRGEKGMWEKVEGRKGCGRR